MIRAAPPPDNALWQAARRARTPDPGAFRLDARDVSDLLLWANGFSRRLTYFSADGERHEPAGDYAPWSAFLQGDALFLLAEISARDAPGEYRRYSSDAKGLNARSALDVKTIVDWRLRAHRLALLTPPDSVENALAGVLDSAAANELNDALPDTLKPPGADESDPAIASMFAVAPATDPAAVYSLVNRVTGQIAGRAHELLDQALRAKPDHTPAVGLLLAFFEMFKQAQDRLNAIPERHLDFYYRQVLRLAPRPAQPDQVDLALVLDPKSPGARLKAGALFVAGSPSAPAPLLYAADNDLDAAPIAIRSFRALSVARSRSPGGRGAIVGVYAFPKADSADGFGLALPQDEPGWSPFGPADPSGRAAAVLGFAISSPLLTLPGGRRCVRLTLDFQGAGGRRFADAVAEYRALVGGGPGRPASESRLRLALAEALAVSASGAAGLFPVSDVKADIDGDRLILDLTIPAEAPGVGPFADPLADPPGPLLQIALAPDAGTYALALFSGLAAARIGLNVRVSEFVAFTANTATGPASPEKPFAPFGALPLAGSALFLDSPALRRPGLLSVRLDLDWQGLPKPPQTFAGYYAGYDLDIAAASYRVELALNRGDHWLALPPGPGTSADQPLFALEDAAEERVRPQSALAGVVASDPAIAAAPAGAPALRVTLLSPDVGFGNAAYPGAVMRFALAQAAKPSGLRAMFSAPPPATPPNPPLAPQVRKLAISYESATDAAPSDDKSSVRFFSLTPLGRMVLAPEGRAFDDLFDYDATLMIGLDGLTPPQTVSLLFDIEETAAAPWSESDDFAAPRLAWRYFDGGVWRELPDASILSDGTQALTRPGVARLALPADLAPGPRYPGGQCWIAVQIDGDVRRYGAIRAIIPNGVVAARVMDAGGAPPPLAARQIAGLLSPLPGVKGVIQPRPSRGGGGAEDTATFRLRVAERLSHRDRAILPEDYARLTLEAFPGLSQVSVISRLQGGIDLVVVPLRTQGARTPPLAPLWLRNEIASWLAPRMGIAAQALNVRNADFEPVRVAARIRLDPQAASGLLGRVAAAIDSFIAPWLDDPEAPLPIGAAELDVTILAAALHALPGVAEVAGLSAVQVYRKRAGGYGLKDSARGMGDNAERRVVKSSGPAATLFPAARHALEFAPARAGVGLLEIGRDFFVCPASEASAYQSAAKTIPALGKRFGLGAMTLGRDFVAVDPQDAVAPAAGRFDPQPAQLAFAPPYEQGALT